MGLKIFGRNFATVCMLGMASIGICNGAVNVACVGNSITEGYGIWDEKKYPQHLQEMLGDGYVVTNFGASSMTFANPGDDKSQIKNQSYWNREHFKNALASKPNIVVIELGTNDSKFFMQNYPEIGAYNSMYQQYSKAELLKDYEALIDTFAHAETAPEIFATLQPYSNNYSWGITDTAIVNQINPIIRETAVRKGVNIIDLHTLFKTPEWFLNDSVHPNAKGAAELARIIDKYIVLEKPEITQNEGKLSVSGVDAYWYKDGMLVSPAKGDKGAGTTLTATAAGTYKALVKMDAESDSWLISSEVTVTESGTGNDPGTDPDSIGNVPDEPTNITIANNKAKSISLQGNTAQIILNAGEEINVRIFDIQGREIWSARQKGKPGINLVSLPQISGPRVLGISAGSQQFVKVLH